MNLAKEVHKQILDEFFAKTDSLDAKGAVGPYGMFLGIQGGEIKYSITDQQTFLRRFPDFPRDRVGDNWLLVVVADDGGTSGFTYPWSGGERGLI